jgi:hypothetical protein
MTVVVRSLNGWPSASVPDTVIGMACTMRVLRRFCVPGSLDGKDSVTIPPESRLLRVALPQERGPRGIICVRKGNFVPEDSLGLVPGTPDRGVTLLRGVPFQLPFV